MLRDRPNVEREAIRQGDRELVGLCEAKEPRGDDKSVGARQEQGVARVVLVINRRGGSACLRACRRRQLRLRRRAPAASGGS